MAFEEAPKRSSERAALRLARRRWARGIAGLLLATPTWLRVTLQVLFGSVIGSSILGVLNTYAVYWFCISRGSRAPIEGVPYLNLAVSSLSFLIFVSTCFYGLLVTWTLAKLKKRTDSPLPIVDRASTATGFVAYILILLFQLSRDALVSLSLALPAVIGFIALLLVVGFTFESRYALPFYTLVVAVAIGFLRWKSFHRWIALTLAISAGVAIAGLMFRPTIYGSFLKLTKYGGGIGINIAYEDFDGHLDEIDSHLFLVTSNVYILYDDEQHDFIEIPIDRVTRLRYAPDGGTIGLPGNDPDLTNQTESVH